MTEVGRDIQSVFQIAAVTQMFLVVSRICDEGHDVTSNAVVAVVRSKGGGGSCRFLRNQSGLHVAKLTLRSPARLGVQE